MRPGGHEKFKYLLNLYKLVAILLMICFLLDDDDDDDDDEERERGIERDQITPNICHRTAKCKIGSHSCKRARLPVIYAIVVLLFCCFGERPTANNHEFPFLQC